MKRNFWCLKPLQIALALCVAVAVSSNSRGQFMPDPILLDSFESTSGISDWSPQNDYVPQTENSIYLSHSQSTVGVTNGSKSLALEVNTGAGWGLALTAAATDADLTLYNAFNTVAQNPSKWYLEADLTLNASSWTNVLPPSSPPFKGLFQLNLAMGDDDGWAQTPATADLYGQNVQVPVRVSLNDLGAGANSSYYQLFLGGSNLFRTTGPTSDPLGAIAYLDNLRFTPAPASRPVTLFSWENGNDGWSDCGLGCGDTPPSAHTGSHIHTIINNSPAATNGTHVLRIDNTRQNDPSLFPGGFGFHWGSTFQLNSNSAPAGQPPVIDPTIQARIENLKEVINSASAFAFDVHFEDLFNGNAYDSFSPSPGWIRFGLALNDGTGSWFQAEGTALTGTPDVNASDTYEYVIGTNIMNDVSTSALGILSQVGLAASNQLGIILSINTNGGVLADIDNFRVIVPVDLSADFDNNGKVDGADLTVFKSSYNKNANADANGDGVSDGQDFLIWQRTFGNDATQSVVALSASDLALLGFSTAVPEPSAILLFAVGAFVATSIRGGCRSKVC
jgi:hypothetical protein